MKLVSVTTGIELALVKGSNIRDRLPKRFAYEVELTVDGAALKVPVTSNKGWAGEAPAIEYFWFLVDGVAYYATLDAGVPASSYVADSWTIAEGAASRKNPARVTTRLETEAARIAAFRATYAARKVETPAAG